VKNIAAPSFMASLSLDVRQDFFDQPLGLDDHFVARADGTQDEFLDADRHVGRDAVADHLRIADGE